MTVDPAGDPTADANRGPTYRSGPAGLLDAVLLIAGDLDLDTVLRSVVAAACSVVDARYGALGVVAEDGEGLSAFVHHGVSEPDAERIGSLPEGHGILGLLIEQPRTLRLDDLTEHPASYGFPANHPPMRTFLGVPIRVGERIFGNLYLTEKRDGGPFTGHDEDLIVGLAAVAGAAIYNARLFTDLQRRERWSAAIRRLSSAVLDTTPFGEVRRLVAQLGAELVGGEVAVVVEPVDDGARRRLKVVGSTGQWLADEIVDAASSAAWPVLEEDRPVRIDLGQILGLPGLWVPVRDGTHVVAALGVGRSTGFTESEERLLAGFGDQASLAWTYERSQAEVRRLSLVEDRERIGRDLHDTVIQRLFATGLSLQAGLRQLDDAPEAAERVTRAVDEIDVTIKEIRSSIFALQWDTAVSGAGLRSDVLRVVDELTRLLPAPPRVRFDGPLDSVVSQEVAQQLVPVVRESLTNVAKHARAASVGVDLVIEGDEIVLRVTDDGIGLPDDVEAGFGLTSLRERAQMVGGRFEITSRPGQGGAVLEWRVPLG